jgi:hypothetical protein
MQSSAVHASPATSPSPSAVHELVCEFVTAQAEAEAEAEAEAGGGWSSYRGVFLSAEVQDLIRSRLAGAAAAASPAEHSDGVEDSISSDGPRSPKKYKIVEASAAPAAAAAAADEVSWAICCCGGATFSVALPDHARVAEAKCAIGVLRGVSRFAMELFVEGEEELLDDERRLSSADKVPLFMLPKEASDRLALEAVFKIYGGAHWTRKKGGWMTEAALGEWQAVTVDVEGRVVWLRLIDSNLAGALPREILQLSALTVLNLGNNKLTGTIPVELGQLGALTALYWDTNQLSGRIPAELGQLGALTKLSLSNNQFAGAIPAELGQLGALMILALCNNQLSEVIPAVLAWLRALEGLYLSSNQLSGQEAFRSHMQEHNPECELELVPED